MDNRKTVCRTQREVKSNDVPPFKSSELGKLNKLVNLRDAVRAVERCATGTAKTRSQESMLKGAKTRFMSAFRQVVAPRNDSENELLRASNKFVRHLISSTTIGKNITSVPELREVAERLFRDQGRLRGEGDMRELGAFDIAAGTDRHTKLFSFSSAPAHGLDMQILVCQIVECAELEGKTRRLSTRINEKRAAEAAGAEVTSEKEKTQASEKDSTRAEAKEKSWQETPPLENNDILSIVVGFTKQFLFVASVSKRFRRAWGGRPAKTELVAEETSVSQLKKVTSPLYRPLPPRHLVLVVIDRAARLGNRDLIEFAWGHMVIEDGRSALMTCDNWSSTTCAEAAGGGHLELLKWLRGRGCPWDRKTWQSAARGGHVRVLQYLLAPRRSALSYLDRFLERIFTRCPGLDGEVFSEAAAGGHIRALKWLFENKVPWNESACESAARSGQGDALRWLRTKGCPWDNKVCAWAARNGDMSMLQYARANGCPWNSQTTAGAAWAERLDIIQYAVSNGCTFGGTAYYWAARRGNLPIIQWAFSHDGGGIVFPEITAGAACGGHDHIILDFAHENDVIWHKLVYHFAAYGGNIGMLRGLEEVGFYPSSDVFGYAAEGGQLDVLKYLHEQCPSAKPDVACERAAFGGHLEVLVWLRENNFPWTWRVRLAAEEGGHRRVLEWAKDNGCPTRESWKIDSVFDPFGQPIPFGGEATIVPLVCPVEYSPRFAAYMAMLPEVW